MKAAIQDCGIGNPFMRVFAGPFQDELPNAIG
jgi:hypothetical protein